jgi:type II secretory pathway pseudopilin PulG
MRKNFTSGEMERQGEQGFMLVGLIVAIFLILLALSVAAPRVAQELRREREVEAVHRGNQYVRAIRVYYRKNGHYPGSIEQLEKTNNIRYLRQQYVDPITGKADWRLIKVGEAKTTVKGFFGQPLVGLAPGLGTAAGSVSPTGTGAAGTGQQSSPFGASGSSGTGGYGGSSPGGGGLGTSSPGTGGLGTSTVGGTSSLGGTSSPGGGLGSSPGGGTTGTTDNSGSSTPGSSGGIASQSATSFSGSAAPFVGVGVPKEGDSITILNEQTTYNTWEFIYDPRIEQLYAKGALFGGGSTGLGANAGSASVFGGTTPGTGNTPATPGSGTGGFSGSPAPTSPMYPTTPTTPPQQPQ